MAAECVEDDKVVVSVRPPSSRCYATIVNVALLCNGLNIGLNMGILGPTLPDLALQTGSTLAQMSLIFVTSSLAYIVGSLASGVLLGRFEGYLLLGVTLVLQAVSTAAAPWLNNLVALAAVISVSYFFSTIIIAGTAYLCFRLERSRARLMTQAAFLLFNLGKAIVPFVVSPFLSPDVAAPTIPSSGLPVPNSTLRAVLRLPRLGNPSDNDVAGNSSSPAYFASYVGYGYAIVAGYSLLMCIPYFGIAIWNGCHLWVTEREVGHNDFDATGSIAIQNSYWRKVAILSVFFLMIFLQCGMESVDAGLMMSFLSEYLGRGKDMGVIATSLYQGSKVVACIAVVLTVRWLYPSTLLFIDLLFMLLSTSMMAASIAFDVNDALLWTTFVLLAIGMSNSYATLASWLETRQRITGVVTSILTISFGLGGMLLPTLTTFLLDLYGPVMFPLVLFGSSVLCFIVYILTKLLMAEPCCPRVEKDIVRVRQVGTDESDATPLVQGETSPKTYHSLSLRSHQDSGRTSRVYYERSRDRKRQSLSELTPDQCFLAYHSRFINPPVNRLALYEGQGEGVMC